MSHLLRDGLQVFLSPHCVAARSTPRRAGIFGNVASRMRHIPLQHTNPTDTTQVDPLHSLQRLVAEFAPKRASLLLSNHFVQFTVMPWRPDLRGRDEYRTLARAQFAQAFGNAVDAWHVEVSDQAPGRTHIGVAVETTLLANISSILGNHQCELQSIKVYALVLPDSNALRRRHPRWSWLAIHEPGRLAILARDERHETCWIRHQRAAADWAAQLQATLHNESLLAGIGLDYADVVLFAPFMSRNEEASVRSQGIRMLPPDAVLANGSEVDPALSLTALL